MRYFLFVLLFVFSTQSFAGELDGKGLDCNTKNVKTLNNKELGKNSRIVFWFNNDTVVNVSVGYNIVGELSIKPESPNIKTYQVSLFLNENTISWVRYHYANIKMDETRVNRKTLEIIEYVFNEEEMRNGNVVIDYQYEGKCKVFKGFDYVKKYQAKRKAEFLKSLEENKI